MNIGTWFHIEETDCQVSGKDMRPVSYQNKQMFDWLDGMGKKYK